MNIKWLLLAGLVVLSNLVVLAGVAYNRSSMIQELTLTERELPVPYWATRGDSENSQMSLRIDWQVAQEEVEDWSYGRDLKVSPQTFNALALKPINCPEQERRHPKSVHAWVALEYAGPAYRQRLQQLEQALAKLEGAEGEEGTSSRERYQRQLEQTRISDSRLYAVAVAPELEVLKVSLGNSLEAHWFLPAELSAAGDCSDSRVYINRLLSGDLYLPASQRDALAELNPRVAYQQQSEPPRYIVDVAVGRRYEPWVNSVAACPESGCPSVESR